MQATDEAHRGPLVACCDWKKLDTSSHQHIYYPCKMIVQFFILPENELLFNFSSSHPLINYHLSALTLLWDMLFVLVTPEWWNFTWCIEHLVSSIHCPSPLKGWWSCVVSVSAVSHRCLRPRCWLRPQTSHNPRVTPRSPSISPSLLHNIPSQRWPRLGDSPQISSVEILEIWYEMMMKQ